MKARFTRNTRNTRITLINRITRNTPVDLNHRKSQPIAAMSYRAFYSIFAFVATFFLAVITEAGDCGGLAFSLTNQTQPAISGRVWSPVRNLKPSERRMAPKTSTPRNRREIFESHGLKVRAFIAPSSVEELATRVRNTAGPISILGGGFSMGGQVATRGGLVIDMSNLNRISELDVENQRVVVQTGISWRQLQEVIDRHGLAVKIMQSYADFTVGGSISVNVHGRYIGFGPMSESVRWIKVLTADGRVQKASRTENSDLFHAAVGGYGAVGVIVEAELDLVPNVKLKREFKEFTRPQGGSLKAAVEQLVEHFKTEVIADPNSQLANADIYPGFQRTRLITYKKTDSPLTESDHFQTELTGIRALLRATLHSAEQLFDWVKWVRESVYEPRQLAMNHVVTRNWEASAHVSELRSLTDMFPIFKKVFGFSRRRSFLQEYFIPVDRLPEFVERMERVFTKHNVNFSNISIRHVPRSEDSILNWAAKDSAALVIYYNQPFFQGEQRSLEVGREWTQEMIEEVLAVGGSYYLPYHLHPRLDQFRRAYPRWAEFARVRKKFDPTGKFSNLFLERYISHKPTYYLRDSYSSLTGTQQVYDFFKHVFGIVPPKEHAAIIESEIRRLKARGVDPSDANLYESLTHRLRSDGPGLVAKLARSAVSLRSQQMLMGQQAAQLLSSTGKTQFEGYLEVGSPGRYFHAIRSQPGIEIKGTKWVTDEVKPSFGPEAALERTGGRGLRRFLNSVVPFRFYPLANYEPIVQEKIKDGSIDLATIFIGLHHAPPERLRPYIASIFKAMRPGGRLILRDHDANNPDLLRIAHVAHITFNAALGIPYDLELNDVRNFQPIEYWVDALEASGFKLLAREGLLQEGDPTRNMLLVFERQHAEVEKKTPVSAPGDPNRLLTRDALKSLPGYIRPGNNTILLGAEWTWVYIWKAWANYQGRDVWFNFPYMKYWEMYKQHRDRLVEYAKSKSGSNPNFDSEMRKLIGFLNVVNYPIMALYEKGASLVRRISAEDRPPTHTGLVVKGVSTQQLSLLPQGLLADMQQMTDEMTYIVTQRQRPFTDAILALAENENVEFLEVAGNETLSVLLRSSSPEVPSALRSGFESIEVVNSFSMPSSAHTIEFEPHHHSILIHARELGRMIRALKETGVEIVQVYDN